MIHVLVLAIAAAFLSVVTVPTQPANGVWQRVAFCESRGEWSDTAGGYEGGLQFLNSTWLANGGGEFAPHAYDATEAEQIVVARRTLRSGGVRSWPVCGPRAGLTMADAS